MPEEAVLEREETISTTIPPDKHIFVINGVGGCGKDTFMDFVGEIVSTAKISIVDYTKEVAESAEWKGGKTERDRKFLAELKDLIDGYNDENYKMVEWFTEEFLNDDHTLVLFVTMREKQDILRYKKQYGCNLILVQNDYIDMITSNHADAGVYDPEIPYDIFIDNNGSLNDLQREAVKFVDRYV